MSVVVLPQTTGPNATVRLYPPPPERDGDRELWPRFHKRRSELVSDTTRKARRMHAHLRSSRRIGGKQKHMKNFMTPFGHPRLAKRHRTLDGSPLADHAERLPQTAYEARATARRPWTVRKIRRVRNKRARVSRKANR